MSAEQLLEEINTEFENHDAWAEAYEKLIKEPPAPETILKTIDGSPARLEVELTTGKPPFIYAKAYVPMIVGERVQWFLHDMETTGSGWKCILLPKSRDQIVKLSGLKKLIIPVQALKVVKHSASRKSVLCDVVEF